MVFRKLGSLFALSSMSCAMSRRLCFCSILSSFGTNLVDTLLMCKSLDKIECTNPMVTPNSVQISRTLIRWSCMIAVCTCSIILSFQLFEGLPEHGSLSTDVRPFLKRLYYSFIREVLMASSPRGLLNLANGFHFGITKIVAKFDTISLLKLFCHSMKTEIRRPLSTRLHK